MTAGATRLPDYLRHLQQAIGRIERYTVGMDEGAFRADTLVQDAVIRNFEVIGEACRNILRDAPDWSNAAPVVVATLRDSTVVSEEAARR